MVCASSILGFPSVLAFAPQDHISDTVFIPHGWQGSMAYAQFSGGFIRVEKPVRIVMFNRILISLTYPATSVICSITALYTEHSIVITFMFCLFLFLRQSSAINKRDFNNSLRDSHEIFLRNESVTRTNGATSYQLAEYGIFFPSASLPLHGTKIKF